MMLHEYVDAFQGREFPEEWVLFHGVPVRNNGIQKRSELRLGVAHRTILIARLSHDPTVRERTRLLLAVEERQCLRRGEGTECTAT